MTFVPPPVGSMVRVSFEGVVEESEVDRELNLAWIAVEDGPYMEWRMEVENPPSVEVVPPAYRAGDVVAWTPAEGDSGTRTLLYMAFPGKPSGWYDGQGREVFPQASEIAPRVRPDGTLSLSLKRGDS